MVRTPTLPPWIDYWEEGEAGDHLDREIVDLP
jgi:hypothetical protein